MTVEQGGRTCPADLQSADGVVVAGLVVVARCSSPVHQVTVRIALLHDVDERYRTLAAAAGPGGVERVMFTAEQPAHELRLSPDAADRLPATAAPSSDERDLRGAFGGSLPLERQFVAAVDGTTSVVAALLAVLVALGVGAVHALAPGHGKAVAAAYLVSDRGRPPRRAAARRRRRRDAHRLGAGPRPGGLLPSPSALLVLLTALAVGRIAFGLTLIAAFSVGLAATVTLTGMAVLRGRDVLHGRTHERAADRLHRLLHAMPVIGAAAVTLAGALLAAQAVLRLAVS